MDREKYGSSMQGKAAVLLLGFETKRGQQGGDQGSYCGVTHVFMSKSPRLTKSLQEHQRKLLDLSLVAFGEKSC